VNTFEMAVVDLCQMIGYVLNVCRLDEQTWKTLWGHSWHPQRSRGYILFLGVCNKHIIQSSSCINKLGVGLPNFTFTLNVLGDVSPE